MEFQVTKANKWNVTRTIYFSGVLGLIGIIYFLVFYLPYWWIGAVGMLFLTAVIMVGPGIYLYKEYMKFNENSVFTIDMVQQKISFFNPAEKSMEASFHEIKRIAIYIPPNNYRNTITMTPMEDFSFARFDLNSGEEFYVTCLMIPKLRKFVQEYFPDGPVVFHRWWLFPSIRLVNYFRKKD